MSQGSVLVVDDDPILLEVTRARLERAGWSVATRAEALGTTEWIEEHRPEIVLLDVSMPALTGDALLERLHRHGLADEVGVVLHSGLSNHELEDLVARTGALGAIQKTGNDQAFLAEFDRLVANFRAHRGDP